MAEENATLKDALVPEPVVEKTVEKKDPPVVAAALAVEDVEAIELGRTLMESGYSKKQLNDLLGAPKALRAIQHMATNDPQEFIKTLEKSDPDAGTKFLEKSAQLYVDRNPVKDGKIDPNAALMQQIADLKATTTKIQTERDQEKTAAQLASIQSRYASRVDDIFSNLPKDTPLTKSEEKAIRAQLSKELAEDPIAFQRISNGNFVDVPKKAQSIFKEWADDKKSALETSKAAREKSKGNAFDELSSGAENSMGVPAGASDSWDATEEAFAKAIQGK